MIVRYQWDEFHSHRVDANDEVVFGGTFDPIHAGHVTVIRALLEKFSRVLLAPTSQNPWKGASTPIALRREMLSIVLQAESFQIAKTLRDPGVHLLSHDYEFSEELVAWLRPQIRGNLYWAVGEDSASHIERWRNWDTAGVPILILPVVIQVHADDIRRGKSVSHPAIRDFIEKNQLFESK